MNKSRAEWLVEYILGPCNCGPEYQSRGLTSPACGLCSNEGAARESLSLAYQLGRDESASRKAGATVDANRDALLELAKQLETECPG